MWHGNPAKKRRAGGEAAARRWSSLCMRRAKQETVGRQSERGRVEGGGDRFTWSTGERDTRPGSSSGGPSWRWRFLDMRATSTPRCRLRPLARRVHACPASRPPTSAAGRCAGVSPSRVLRKRSGAGAGGTGANRRCWFRAPEGCWGSFEARWAIGCVGPPSVVMV
jgi:hypothetical protein